MRLVSQIQIQSQPQSRHPSRILNLLFVILTRNTSFKTQNRLESLESVSHCGEGNPDLIYGVIQSYCVFPICADTWAQDAP